MSRLDVIVASNEPPIPYEQRMEGAVELEDAAARRLADARWAVCQFGQAMLTPEVRRELRKTDSDLRWLPDWMAVRFPAQCLIDAKTSYSTTDNWSIELRAHRAHLGLVAAYGSPVAYFFKDATVALATDLVIETMMDGSFTRGSGTPFLLTKKRYGVPFDALFGSAGGFPQQDWRAAGRFALDAFELAIDEAFGADLPASFWRGKR